MSAPSSSTPSSSNSNADDNNDFLSIILFVVSGVVIIAVAALVTKCYLRRTKQSSASAAAAPQARGADSIVELGSVEKFLDGIMKEKPVRFSPQHLVDCTWNYSETLGSGAFGVVYKGVLLNGVQVAVKVLRGGTLDKRAEEQFMAEVGTIGRTYHVNLVKLYGFCFDATVKALVYEYMEKGSLEGYLFGEEGRGRRIGWEKLREIAVGTAKGIRYLHEECQQRIVHYDIKPGNVLLAADLCPKVADFGLARLCDREDTHVAITGGEGDARVRGAGAVDALPRDAQVRRLQLRDAAVRGGGEEEEPRARQGEEPAVVPDVGVGEVRAGGAGERGVGLRDRRGGRGEGGGGVQGGPVVRPVPARDEAVDEQRGVTSALDEAAEGDEEIAPPANPFLYMVSPPPPALSSSWSSSK